MSQQTQNSMKKISLAKVVLNMGIGTSGEPIERASNLAGKAAGKADQLASKVGVRVNPSRKVARTLAVAKKLKRFV